MQTILICGFGDIGVRVAAHWRKNQSPVFGCCRSDPNLKVSQGFDANLDSAQKIQWLKYDLDNIPTDTKLPDSDIIYYFAPPPKMGQKDTRLAGFLSLLASSSSESSLKKLILISTSAVYGDCRGAWVTEKSATAPTLDRGKRRLDAECIATDWCRQHAKTLVILRVPGIYGPGRLPLERLKKALPVLQQSAAPYTNRIHAEDLAQICVRAAEQGIEGIFNVCDGEPGNMSQYFFAVADAYGLPRPEEVNLEQAQQQLSAGMLSYLSESRRMDNRKLLQHMNYQFLYPNLAAGLKDCVTKK